MSKNITLVLSFTVEYKPNGTSEDELRTLLSDVAQHAMDRGLVTGETPAEVVKSDIRIRKVA
jgi:hypothetical protein